MANTRVGPARWRGILCAVALGAAVGIGASPALGPDGIDPDAEQGIGHSLPIRLAQL